MTVPTLNHYRIVAQYNLKNEFAGYVKPYQLRAAIRNQVELYLRDEPLPEENHHRVEMSLVLTGAGDTSPAFRAASTVEAIVIVASSMQAQDVSDTLRTEVAGALLGMLRSNLSTLLLGTGFPALVLPPLDVSALRNLPASPEASSSGTGNSPSLTA